MGVGEAPSEAPGQRQCEGVRNPSHGEGLRSSLVAGSRESHWGKDRVDRAELGTVLPVAEVAGERRNRSKSAELPAAGAFASLDKKVVTVGRGAIVKVKRFFHLFTGLRVEY